MHSADHQDTERFCMNVLFNSELIKEYIEEVSHLQEEGRKVS